MKAKIVWFLLWMMLIAEVLIIVIRQFCAGGGRWFA
jgi:hypothetical protein